MTADRIVVSRLLLAIDPGPARSAWLILHGSEGA